MPYERGKAAHDESCCDSRLDSKILLILLILMSEEASRCIGGRSIIYISVEFELLACFKQTPLSFAFSWDIIINTKIQNI